MVNFLEQEPYNARLNELKAFLRGTDTIAGEEINILVVYRELNVVGIIPKDVIKLLKMAWEQRIFTVNLHYNGENIKTNEENIKILLSELSVVRLNELPIEIQINGITYLWRAASEKDIFPQGYNANSISTVKRRRRQQEALNADYELEREGHISEEDYKYKVVNFLTAAQGSSVSIKGISYEGIVAIIGESTAADLPATVILQGITKVFRQSFRDNIDEEIKSNMETPTSHVEALVEKNLDNLHTGQEI